MSNFKRDRKGFLLAEETLKIIIAVICVVFLIYILVAVYNSNTSAKKIEEAKGVLLRFEEIISFLKEGAIESQDVFNPKGWHIYSFMEERPNSCLNENCICICDNSLIEQIKSQEKKCDEKGACLIVPNLLTSKLDLAITGTNDILFVGIRKQDGNIFIGELK